MNDPNLPPPSPVPLPVPGHPAAPAPLSREDCLWGMLGHLSALAGIPFPIVGNIVGPLIVWQLKKDTLPFAAEEAKEALNFNISWSIWSLLLGVVPFILIITIVGILLVPLVVIAAFAVAVIWVVFMVVGGLRANEGRPYRYPLTVRFIK